ncbi:MAG: gamma-glutamyltransferase [Chloroflexi bacterium]|nr:gamma-glutamyltransferase [Chloroflexota bacterium]
MVAQDSGRNGVVIADSPYSAEIGLAALRRGGNAVDAIVSAGLAHAVCRPALNGIFGWGGGMVLYFGRTGRAVAITMSGITPLATTPDLFEPVRGPEDHTVLGLPGPDLGLLLHSPELMVKDDLNSTGYLSILVSPVLRAYQVALESFGNLTIAEALAPAIELAEAGFAVDRDTRNTILGVEAIIQRFFLATAEILMPGGRVPEAGELIRQADLAQTLRAVAREGPEILYTGWLARTIVDDVRSHGGILTMADMARACDMVGPEEAVAVPYRNHVFYTPDLGTSGGTTAMQILKLLEPHDLTGLGPTHPEYLHLAVEAGKVVWRDRFRTVGDPAAMPVPPAELLSAAYLARLREEHRQALLGKGPAHPAVTSPGSPNTTHLIAVDREGNLASLTMTQAINFGSLATVPGTGIILNGGMSSFDPRPGRPNSLGPWKRPAQRMSPTVATRAGWPALALGGTGGRRIIAVLAQVIANLVDFGLSPAAALLAPRFYVEAAEPVWIEYGGVQEQVWNPTGHRGGWLIPGSHPEWSFDGGVVDALRERGHTLRYANTMAGSQHVARIDEDGLIHGAAEPRREGSTVAAC